MSSNFLTKSMTEPTPCTPLVVLPSLLLTTTESTFCPLRIRKSNSNIWRRTNTAVLWRNTTTHCSESNQLSDSKLHKLRTHYGVSRYLLAAALTHGSTALKMEIVTSENIIWKSPVLWSLFTDPGESMKTTVKVAQKITRIIAQTFCYFRISKICPGLGECSFPQGIPSFPESFPTSLKHNPSYISKAYSRDDWLLEGKENDGYQVN